MSKVIPFPSKVSQDWLCFEQSLSKVLDKLDVSDTFQQHIKERMRVIFNDFDFSFELALTLPSEYFEQVSEEIYDINACLQKRTQKLLLSRLSLEIELAKCQGYQ